MVLIDKANKCSYNNYIATLGKMLNSNSNNQCLVSLTFPLTGLLKVGGEMMQERLEVGSHVFIVESNRIITEVIIAARRGNFYTVKFFDGGAIQLRQTRIFLSREDAERQLLTKVIEKRSYHSPYDYGM